MRRQWFAVLVAVPLLLLGLAACGGSGNSSGSGASDTSSSEDPQDQAVKFAQCMREHGVDIPDPETDDQGRMSLRLGGGEKVDKDKVDAAMEACKKYNPIGDSGRLNDLQNDPEFQEAQLRWAQCMRDHGVDVPDPGSGEHGRSRGRQGPEQGEGPGGHGCLRSDPARFLRRLRPWNWKERRLGMSQTTERTQSGDGEVTGPVRPEGSPLAGREQSGADAARPKGSRRRRRTRIVAATAVVVVAGAGAVSWATGLFDGDSGNTTATAASRLSTAKVERGDLVETQGVDGTLGYGDAWGISSAAQGTVTWLPAEGSRITRGETLYEVDEKPVTLMYGTIPLYRALGQGDEGNDVKELEQNLAALGYTGFDVDDNYTSATAAAVKDWQTDRGLDQTGRVDSSQIVFSSGALRVASQKVRVGDRAAQGPLITVTPTSQIVTVNLDVADRDLARKGRAVTIDLPGGKTVKGHITSVGTVAESASSDQNSGDQSSSDSATIEVIVTIDKGQSAAGLDQAPVTVNMESSRTKDVLSVPVAALLAISDDAYAVQVIQPDGTTRMVPVDIGTFADGRVEVEGDGITEGTVVGVPKT